MSLQQQLQSGHKLATDAALTNLLRPDHLRFAASLGGSVPLLAVTPQFQPAAPEAAGVPGRAPELTSLLFPPPVLVGAVQQCPRWSQALWGGSLLAAAGQHHACVALCRQRSKSEAAQHGVQGSCWCCRANKACLMCEC